MLKSLGTGLLILLFLCLVAIFGTNIEWLLKYATWVGVGCLVLAIIYSNAIPYPVMGSHMRGQDTKEDRQRKNRWSSYLLFVALPNIAGAIVIYLYLHR